MIKRLFGIFTSLILFIVLFSSVVTAGFIDMDAEPPVVASSGSYKNTYDTQLDFTISGGDLKSATWTRVQGYIGYNLSGTIKTGEDISVSLVGTQSPVPETNAKADLVFNNLTMSLVFLDNGGRPFGSEIKYTSDNVKKSPLSHDFEVTVPKDAVSVKITGSFTCRWVTPHAVAEETVALNVILKVTEDSSLTPGGNDADQDKKTVEPSEHASPIITVIISIAAACAAAIGAAAAAGAGAVPQGPPDPVFERSKIPDHPDTVRGRNGEIITRKPDGSIEIRQPTGEVDIEFPNGTRQTKWPDGTTTEEWPDGTQSATSAEGDFITRTPDGRMIIVGPDGYEYTYEPDGTSVTLTPEGKKITFNNDGTKTIEEKGLKKTVDEDDIVIKVEREDGFVSQKQPDGKINMTSPYGGSITYDPLTKKIEGEIRGEDSKTTFEANGKITTETDDGTLATVDEHGNLECTTKEGAKYVQTVDGIVSYKDPDGTRIKTNTNTGEYDMRLPDGSYVQIDEKGNMEALDNEKGLEFKARKDGHINVRSKDGEECTVEPDGSWELKSADGWSVNGKEGVAVTVKGPNGGTMTINPDGTQSVNAADGSTASMAEDGSVKINRPDGTTDKFSADEFKDHIKKYAQDGQGGLIL